MAIELQGSLVDARPFASNIAATLRRGPTASGSRSTPSTAASISSSTARWRSGRHALTSCDMDGRPMLYIEELLEHVLPDDRFDELVEMLDDGVPFSFSRFGDGEFNAIFGLSGANCDGHRYFPDLGRRLEEILQRHPEYLLGLQPLAIIVHGVKQILSVSSHADGAKGIQWVLADSLHIASLDGRLDLFFDALRGRRTMLVGPEHLREFSLSKGWDYQQVPARNCWTAYEETLDGLKTWLSDSGDVVLFCASMMSNVLIDDLFTYNPANTYIDAGSVFDPSAGVVSRPYHKGLRLG